MPEETTPDLLLTGDEIQNITNRSMPTDLAQKIAQIATDAVRDYCGWRVAKTKTETITVASRGGSRLFLPSLHILSIDAVSDGDHDLIPGDYDWSEGGVLERVPYGGRHRWKRGRRAVTVTLTHGYETCPGGIAQSIAAAVARGALAPAGGITSETAIGQTYVYSRGPGGIAAGAAFSPDELARLDAHRIPSGR